MKKIKKPIRLELALLRETVRRLTEANLELVVGGVPKVSYNGDCRQ